MYILYRIVAPFAIESPYIISRRSYIFVIQSLNTEPGSVETDVYSCPLVGLRFGAYCVTEPRADEPAEVQPDSARALVGAAIAAGAALFEYARQVLGRDADTGVLDTELISGNID